jgi:hypothetical protein
MKTPAERVTVTLPKLLRSYRSPAIDKRRVRRVYGELPSEEIAAIDEGLAAFLGLADRLRPRVEAD